MTKAQAQQQAAWADRIRAIGDEALGVADTTTQAATPAIKRIVVLEETYTRTTEIEVSEKEWAAMHTDGDDKYNTIKAVLARETQPQDISEFDWEMASLTGEDEDNSIAEW